MRLTLCGLTLFALVSWTARAEVDADAVRAASHRPEQVAALFDGLAGEDVGAAAAQLMEQAAGLPLSEDEFRQRVVELTAELVKHTGENAPAAVLAAVRALPPETAAVAIAAAVLNAGDRAAEVSAALLDGLPLEMKQLARAAILAPSDTLGPALTGILTGGAAGTVAAGAEGTSLVQNPQTEGGGIPVETATPTLATTTTTAVSSSSEEPPPVDPYAGQ